MDNDENPDPSQPPLQDFLQNAHVGNVSKALSVNLLRVIDAMSVDIVDLLEDKGASSTETSTQMAKLTSDMIKLVGQHAKDILRNYSSPATDGQDGTAAPPGGSAPGS